MGGVQSRREKSSDLELFLFDKESGGEVEGSSVWDEDERGDGGGDGDGRSEEGSESFEDGGEELEVLRGELGFGSDGSKAGSEGDGKYTALRQMEESVSAATGRKEEEEREGGKEGPLSSHVLSSSISSSRSCSPPLATAILSLVSSDWTGLPIRRM